MINHTELSKELSYILRHAPQKYGITLDKEGWVSTTELLAALHMSNKWKSVTEQDLSEMIELSSKKRHEINNGKIRAYYGHSTPEKISKTKAEPPTFLYHGTTRATVEKILKAGLKPRQRQYVHLSKDIETAIDVGGRRDRSPVLLLVEASKAFADNIGFYLGNDNIWLADEIPAKYISIYNKNNKN